MKKILLLVSLFTTKLYAQELFVFTEPASNMATKSIGVRLDNMFTKNDLSNKTTYSLAPEIMLGVSKKIMVHATGYFDNMDAGFKASGGALYIKYRFYSEDEVHSHFRLAAFGRAAFNNNSINEYAVALGRRNSGYETGIVGTKLINKTAISASASFLHALDNGGNKYQWNDGQRNAVNYTISAGRLVLPKEYTSYRQVNMNLMLELLGQTNLYKGDSYIDAAPSVQFIFNSRTRVDAGYRFALLDNLLRHEQNSVLLRLEYNFYNVIK